MKPILFNDAMVRAILDGRKTQTRRVVKDMPPQPKTDCHPAAQQKHPKPYFDAYCGQRTTTANPRGMSNEWCWWQVDDRLCLPMVCCPFGKPGDRLRVREGWRIGAWQLWSEAVAIDYRADSFCRREWIRIGDDDAGEAFDKYLKQSIADVKAAGLSADADGHYHWKAGESPCRWRPSIHMPRWASRITLEITDVRVQRLQDISEEDAIAEGVVCPRLGTYGMNPETVFRDLWDSIAKPGTFWRDNPWVWAISFKRVEA